MTRHHPTTFALAALTAGLFILFGCGGAGPSTDSETHWQQLCSEDDDCADDLSCLCGVCTQLCDDNCTGVDGDAVCQDVSDTCDDVGEPICLEECADDTDCGDGLHCVAGSCEPEDGFEVSEPNDEPESDPEPTMPTIHVDLDCPIYGDFPWNDTCGWIRSADAAIHGTLEDIASYPTWPEGEDAPESPVDSCEDASQLAGLKLTVSVDDELYGDVDDTVEVYLPESAFEWWIPLPICSEETPATPQWARSASSTSDWEDLVDTDVVGPLQVGQNIGLTLYERQEGYFTNTDAVDPLFLEDNGDLVWQNGARFGCSPVSTPPSQTFEEFTSDIDACLELNLEEQCSVQFDEICHDTSVNCCPTGCVSHQGRHYDLEEECYDFASFGCSPAPQPEQMEDPIWYCSEDGSWATHLARPPAEDLDVVECTELDEFDEPPSHSDFDLC